MSAAAADYTIGEVAAMIGFSPHTIRAWERRHKLLKPFRTASGQRRYTSEDIELLREVINGVVVRGLTLKVAVRAARGDVSVHAGDRASANGHAEAPLAFVGPAVGEELPAPWRAVADFLPMLIAILDEHGAILDANVRLASATGCVREQLQGRRLLDFVDPYDRAKAVTAFRPPFQRRRGWELNLRLPGGEAIYAFDCLPIRSGARQLLIVIGQQALVGATDD